MTDTSHLKKPRQNWTQSERNCPEIQSPTSTINLRQICRWLLHPHGACENWCNQEMNMELSNTATPKPTHMTWTMKSWLIHRDPYSESIFFLITHNLGQFNIFSFRLTKMCWSKPWGPKAPIFPLDLNSRCKTRFVKSSRTTWNRPLKPAILWLPIKQWYVCIHNAFQVPAFLWNHVLTRWSSKFEWQIDVQIQCHMYKGWSINSFQLWINKNMTGEFL